MQFDIKMNLLGKGEVFLSILQIKLQHNNSQKCNKNTITKFPFEASNSCFENKGKEKVKMFFYRFVKIVMK